MGISSDQHITVVYGLMPLAQQHEFVFQYHVNSEIDRLSREGLKFGDGLYISGANVWPVPGSKEEPAHCTVVLAVESKDEGSFYNRLREALYKVYPVFNRFGHGVHRAHVTVAYIRDPRDKENSDIEHTMATSNELKSILEKQFKGKPLDVKDVFADDNDFGFYGKLPGKPII